MALLNIGVEGLAGCVALNGKPVEITTDDAAKALTLRERALQTVSGGRQYSIHRATPAFSGRMAQDFAGCEFIDFHKTAEAAVRAAMAWDHSTLYVGYEVKDASPWTNGAADAVQMYCSGDTVDLQLTTDAQADPKRTEAGAGDLRLSIGNFQGKPTAVIYRKVSPVKKTRLFSSGVVKEYVMDQVEIVAEVAATVTITHGKGYTLEAAIPLAVLGLAPAIGMKLGGDLGVTHGDPSALRTQLRTSWSNQQTGLVADVVLELKMVPASWGRLAFTGP